MGTNFYLMSRNKKLMREYFAVETEYTIKDIEYEIVDEPYLGYKVHLCKLSAGWRPLFQRHKTISTFKEVEEFCLKNKSMVSIYDEYGRRYTWKQYFKKVYNHSQRKAEPRKWIYDIDPIFPDNGPRLHIRNGEVAWKAGNNGTIVTVKNVMKKNNILVTRRTYSLSFERNGHRCFSSSLITSLPSL